MKYLSFLLVLVLFACESPNTRYIITIRDDDGFRKYFTDSITRTGEGCISFVTEPGDGSNGNHELCGTYQIHER